MSAPQTSSQTDATNPDAWERALLDRQLAMLDRLAEMGLAIAGAIERRATEGGPDAGLDHAPMDFARVSRAVRMTLALQSRLVRDFKAPPKAGQAANDDDDGGGIMPEIYWGDGEPLTKPAEKRVLCDAVSGVAKDRGLDRETVERLTAEAVERWEGLERDEIYGRLNRPFGEIVAQICEDLGLGPHLPREWQFAAGGGPPADPGVKPGEERVVEGAGRHSPPFNGSS